MKRTFHLVLASAALFARSTNIAIAQQSAPPTAPDTSKLPQSDVRNRM